MKSRWTGDLSRFRDMRQDTTEAGVFAEYVSAEERERRRNRLARMLKAAKKEERREKTRSLLWSMGYATAILLFLLGAATAVAICVEVLGRLF